MVSPAISIRLFYLQPFSLVLSGKEKNQTNPHLPLSVIIASYKAYFLLWLCTIFASNLQKVSFQMIRILWLFQVILSKNKAALLLKEAILSLRCLQPLVPSPSSCWYEHLLHVQIKTIFIWNYLLILFLLPGTRDDKQTKYRTGLLLYLALTV